jgi:hypothetical protein
MALFAEWHGVGGVKGKLVFAGEDAAGWNTDPEELTCAVDLELLDGA